MSHRLKHIAFLIGGAVALLLLAALVVLPWVDFHGYKPRLEAAASRTLGMDVHIGGRLSLGVFPGFHVAMTDARILDPHTGTVASAKRTTLWIALLPLLRGEFRVSRIVLRQPVLTIERPEGEINLEGLRKAAALLGDGVRVSLSDGTLRYTDKRSGQAIEATGFDLRIDHLRFAEGKGAQPRKVLALEADLACGDVRTKDVSASALKISVRGKDGVFDFEPVTLRAFGSQAKGSLRVDASGPVALGQVRCSLPGFRIEEFLKVLSPSATMEGSMDFTASLSMRGATMSQMVRTSEGEISLRGKDLKLMGSDLDRALSRFESSRSFNLVDVGAVFLAGPLGLAVTRSYSFAKLFAGSGDSTRIGTFVSDWRVDSGGARAKDVAMSTAKHRIALRGGLDFVDQRFDDMTVAVVDAQGCPMMRQAIRGSFEKPVLEKPHVLTSLAGPVVKVLRQTRALLPKGPCEVFYSGSVAPPKQE